MKTDDKSNSSKLPRGLYPYNCICKPKKFSVLQKSYDFLLLSMLLDVFCENYVIVGERGISYYIFNIYLCTK